MVCFFLSGEKRKFILLLETITFCPSSPASSTSSTCVENVKVLRLKQRSPQILSSSSTLNMEEERQNMDTEEEHALKRRREDTSGSQKKKKSKKKSRKTETEDNSKIGKNTKKIPKTTFFQNNFFS